MFALEGGIYAAVPSTFCFFTRRSSSPSSPAFAHPNNPSGPWPLWPPRKDLQKRSAFENGDHVFDCMHSVAEFLALEVGARLT